LVFTDEQEAILVQYLHRAADIYYGLSPVDVRKLAFQFATKVGFKMPSTCIEKIWLWSMEFKKILLILTGSLVEANKVYNLLLLFPAQLLLVYLHRRWAH
jgi:hypothetical protein